MVLVVLMTTQSLELTCVLRCVHRFSKILVMQDIKQKKKISKSRQRAGWIWHVLWLHSWTTLYDIK